MTSRNARRTILGISAVCACIAWLVWMVSGPWGRAGAPASNNPLDAESSNPLAEPIRETQERVAANTRVETESNSPDAAAEQVDSPDPLSPASLKLAIETTLVGQMDAGNFLDAAMALSQLEIQKNPIPVPGPFGSIRYPLLGTPDGVTAELWVRRGDPNSKLGDPILTYHVNVKTDEDYLFEGTLRRGLDAQIGLWTDKQGEIGQFNVLTNSMISHKSKAAGMEMEGRTIATGMLFCYDPKTPNQWIVQNCGIKNGTPYDADDRPASIQGEWPRTEDLKVLKSGLLNQYGQL